MSDPSGGCARVRIRLYYDLASSLCYIAHRVLGRMQSDLDAIGVELAWSPIDLARLVGWKRGEPLSAQRLANVERVSRELEVPLRTPPLWLDSRRAMAVERVLCEGSRAATWRERLFTAIYEEGRLEAFEAAPGPFLGDLGWQVPEQEVERGLLELEEATHVAWQENVTGVPTFMLDQWPFGGIQSEATLRSILGRFVARRQRRREASA